MEPQSLAALVDTIEVECRQKAAAGANTLVLTPGHYGEDFLAAHPVPWPVVTCSNFIGDALDICASLGFERVLLVGHVGKLCKLAAGVMNTHSRWADARLETLAASLILAGGEAGTAAALLGANTTEEALDILHGCGWLEKTMENLMEKITYHLEHRTGGKLQAEAVVFSNVYESSTFARPFYLPRVKKVFQ